MSGYISIKEEDPNTTDAINLMNELSDTLEYITGNSGRSSFNPSLFVDSEQYLQLPVIKLERQLVTELYVQLMKILQRSNECMQKEKAWVLEQKFYLTWRKKLRRWVIRFKA